MAVSFRTVARGRYPVAYGRDFRNSVFQYELLDEPFLGLFVVDYCIIGTLNRAQTTHDAMLDVLGIWIPVLVKFEDFTRTEFHAHFAPLTPSAIHPDEGLLLLFVDVRMCLFVFCMCHGLFPQNFLEYRYGLFDVFCGNIEMSDGPHGFKAFRV